MAVNPINNYSKLRLMGLSSGMDTDTIIKQMLQLHQRRIDTRFRARTQFEWKQEALTNVGNLLTDFRWKYLTVMGPDAMRLSSVYNSTVASINGKNKDAISVQTTINSPTGTMKIGEIASLAKTTSVSTTGNASRSGEGFKPTDKLGDILLSNGEIKFGYDGVAKLNINGTNIELNKAELAAARASGQYEANRTESDGTVTTQTFAVNNDIDYINAKIWENRGSLISFQERLVPGTTYYELMIEGRNPNSGGPPYAVTEIDFTNYALWGLTFTNGVADFDIRVNGADVWVDLNEMNSLIADPGSGINNSFDYLNSLISAEGGFPVIYHAGEFVGDDYTHATINGKDVVVQKNDSAENIFANTNDISRWIKFDENGKFNFRINGVLIELNKNMTIDDMLREVNDSSAGVKMSYDRLGDMFTVENKKTGASDLTVWGMEAFGISNGTYNNGSLARVMINGEWLEKDSNDFNYRGVVITLNSTTGPVAPGEETIVTLKRDAAEPVAKIKSFIDEYNALIKKLEDMLNEKKSGKETSYGPLTDEEKALMTEKQIADWEAVAKKGLLRNESGLQNMIFSLRNSLYESIKSAGLSPADIGIKTGSYYDGTGGQIILDESKLKAALEADPERVMDVFMGGSESTNSSDRGLLWRIDDIMRGYTNGSQSVTIGSLENSIRRENEQIDKLQKKMYDEEERLYLKFAAMETALSKLQEQSDWFTSMLNGNQQK